MFSLQNVEKPLVLLCVCSKMLKKPLVLLCFRSKMLKNHWFYCVFAQQCWKTNGFTVFSLQNVEKPLVLHAKRPKEIEKPLVLLENQSQQPPATSNRQQRATDPGSEFHILALEMLWGTLTDKLFREYPQDDKILGLSLIHIWRCRRSYACRSRWSPYH